MLRVIDCDIKTATKMLGAILTIALLASVNCLPVDEEGSVQPAVLPPQPKPVPDVLPPQPVLPTLPPSLPPQENAPLPPQEGAPLPSQENVPLQPEVPLPPPEGGAPLPGDVGESPDGNPAVQPGNSDLDTDATIWGGYGFGYRPYYGGWGYSSPWRRWGGYGYGRGYYGGWGWGGGRGWGWGGRGWGWGGKYWG